MTSIVTLPYEYYFDPDSSQPISNGYVYVGVPDMDPEIPANQLPVTLRQEDGTEVVIDQSVTPIRTGAGGGPEYNGSPVQVLVGGAYSIKVLDNLGAQKYYSSDVLKGVSLTTTTGVVVYLTQQAAIDNATAGETLTIAYRATPGDLGGGDFSWIPGDQSANIISDQQKGVWFAPASAPTGASGAWKRNYSGSVNVLWFGAIDNAESTAAIQGALDYSLDVFAPYGRYIVSDTLVMQRNGRFRGAGAEKTILQRTANYGDTLQVSGSNFEVSGLWFYKPQEYTAGVTTTITYPVAAGAAHIAVTNGQRARIRDCFFWKMPYSITVEQTSLLWIENCNFNGMWDSQIPGLQEGISSIHYKTNGTNANTLVTIRGCHIAGGHRSVPRDITVGTHTFSHVEQLGPQFGVLVDSAEGLNIYDSYVGGQSSYCIKINPGQITAAIKIWGNFFDTGMAGVIMTTAQTTSNWTVGLQINDNNFNGQLLGLEALRIESPAGFRSVVNLNMDSNLIENYLQTPLILVGVTGGSITDNTITNYAARGGGAGNPSIAAGCRVFSGSVSVYTSGNKYGGGTNNPAGANNCEWGIFWNDGATGSSRDEINVNLGAGSPAKLIGGFNVDIDRITDVKTDAGNYTFPEGISTVLVNKTVGSITQIAPMALPPIGYRITMKDAKGDAGIYPLQFVGTVDGVANPVYSTNYVSVTLMFNGVDYSQLV